MNISLKDNLKRNKGITLIALVITIIVLLILAGVSIVTLTGDNGILNKAQSAKVETEKANEKEQIDLAVLSSKTNTDLSIDKKILREELSKINEIIDGVPEDGEYDLPVTVIGKSGTKYIIDEEGNIKGIVDNNEIEEPTKLVQPGEIAEATVKNNYKDNNDETATIPRGFKVSEIDNIIDAGLVVIAPDKSEFVWIPVDENLRVAGVEEKEIAAEVDGNYKEKLYSFSGTQSKCFAVKRTRIMREI